MNKLLLLPLASLFSALLAGNACTSCFGYKPSTYTTTVELTPEEYAQWSKGMPPPDTGDPTTGDPTTGGSTGGSTGDVMLTPEEVCTLICMDAHGNSPKSCDVDEEPTPEGKITVNCQYTSICEGRRHACVRSTGAGAGAGPAAAWLARAAHDEAASVHAFAALARELAAHGAPAALLDAVEAARRDELRHAELAAMLAQRQGAEVPVPEIDAAPLRDLLALAVENAVEGCVRETWAALSAAHQARAARDPEVRRLYAEIAADEARHADLAWAIDAWLREQLGPAARELVGQARRAAAQQLRRELAAMADTEELAALGVPPRATALHLAAGLDAVLWSQAA